MGKENFSVERRRQATEIMKNNGGSPSPLAELNNNGASTLPSTANGNAAAVAPSPRLLPLPPPKRRCGLDVRKTSTPAPPPSPSPSKFFPKTNPHYFRLSSFKRRYDDDGDDGDATDWSQTVMETVLVTDRLTMPNRTNLEPMSDSNCGWPISDGSSHVVGRGRFQRHDSADWLETVQVTDRLTDNRINPEPVENRRRQIDDRPSDVCPSTSSVEALTTPDFEAIEEERRGETDDDGDGSDADFYRTVPRENRNQHMSRIIAGIKDFGIKGELCLTAAIHRRLLTITIERANNLSPPSGFSYCSAYVRILLIPDEGRKVHLKTKLVPNNNKPVFNETFSVEILPEDLRKRLLVSVWHKTTTTDKSVFLGCMSFTIRHLSHPDKQVDGWYFLLSPVYGKRKHLAIHKVTMLTYYGPLENHGSRSVGQPKRYII